MSLPALSNWEATHAGLHQAAQVLGGFRKAAAKPLPNYAHLGLFVTPQGVTTSKLPNAGELVLDFTKQAVRYNHPDHSSTDIPLEGQSQMTLADSIQVALRHAGHAIEPDRGKITNSDLWKIDPVTASDYAAALHSIYTAIARFRGRLLGSLSPMIVWPHGFDLSFLWFPKGADESKDPHMNFGFSPGSPGFPRPYIYIYAHPIPEGFMAIKLPEGARWNREKWTGVLIDYDYLAGHADHEGLLENMLHEIYAASEPLMQ